MRAVVRLVASATFVMGFFVLPSVAVAAPAKVEICHRPPGNSGNTQIRTGEGWLYLAMLMDLYSRKIVVWSTSHSPRQEIALEALEMAIDQRRPRAGLIHHTDRGGQYSSAAYQDLLDEHGLVCSMSRPGQCLDNAVAESFFHTLKTEWIYHAHYKTRREAWLAIFEYIEGFYNTTRMHSSLDYRSPEEYEREGAAA